MSTFYRINSQYEVPLSSPRIVQPVWWYACDGTRWRRTDDYGIVQFLEQHSGRSHPNGLFWRLYRREDKSDHYSLSTYRASLGIETFLIEDVPLLTIASYVAKWFREQTGHPCFAMEDMSYDAPK